MRLKISLGCDCGTVLPFNYNHCLTKAITGAVHSTNTLIPNRCQGFSLFTFSQLYFDQYCVAEKGIESLGKDIHWYVSSPKIYFLEGLLKGLETTGSISLANISLPIQDVEVLGDPDIGGLMEFSCMSPISIAYRPDSTEARPRYGRIDDYDFAEKLRQDLINKYYHVYDSLPNDESLKFDFNQLYIKNKRRVSRLVDYNGIKILGYMVPFTVKGNPELIRLGYQLGFGHRNNFGFGMVKIWYPSQPRAQSEDEVG